MRRVLMTFAVLLTVCFLVADSASAGRRHRGRRCHESCCASACCNACNSCNSCCERTTCCQPAPCCQPSVRHEGAYHDGERQEGVHHDGNRHEGDRDQKPMKAPEMPKAPPPEVMK